MTIRVAAAAYPLDPLESWDAYAAKLEDWVAAAEADLLVFPEYGAMELAMLSGPETAGDLAASLRAVAALEERAAALHAALAARHGVHILGASGPAAAGGGFVNRARLYGPGGCLGWQDKLIMTRFERERWGVSPGRAPVVFDTPLGRIGVAICYDAEFPLIVRAMVEAGAETILVPSCTDALAGYWRVRLGAMARALESQCVVVHAPTVGPARWSPAVDENTGAAAVYGPPDLGFPETGVIAEGALNAPGWVRAELDPAAVARVRRDGRVLNLRHWEEQAGIGPVQRAQGSGGRGRGDGARNA